MAQEEEIATETMVFFGMPPQKPHTKYSKMQVLSVLSIQLIGLVERTSSFSYSMPFPTTKDFTSVHKQSLAETFDAMIDSTDFLVKTQDCKAGECSVPLFGEDVKVSFGPTQYQSFDTPSEYSLTLAGETVQEADFGWICAKFLECRQNFPGLAVHHLSRKVAQHFNEQPPHPGYDARDSALQTQQLDQLLPPNTLAELEEKGFVVVDSDIKTSFSSNEKLGNFVVGRTGQEQFRTDRVAFMNQDDAASCGVSNHFQMLMGIANHLNCHMNLAQSEYEPISPGTNERPLANPSSVQIAEYSEGDFYCAHSDNSWTEPGIRQNYRHYTCILYCNEGWSKDDGGALRLFLDSTELLSPAEAKTRCPYVDIVPSNGRLLVFDSTLVHSVEKVTQSETPRQALTLWILRPEESGARGEVYYTEE